MSESMFPPPHHGAGLQPIGGANRPGANWISYQRGQFLDGSEAYSMRIPPNRPAELSWSMTVYDVVDRSVPAVVQLAPPVDASTPLKRNEDRSVDLYFAPEQPAMVPASNWIRTIDGHRFMAILRLFGDRLDPDGVPWEPGELVRIERASARLDASSRRDARYGGRTRA